MFSGIISDPRSVYIGFEIYVIIIFQNIDHLGVFFSQVPIAICSIHNGIVYSIFNLKRVCCIYFRVGLYMRAFGVLTGYR
jgi:hypothetical protein